MLRYMLNIRLKILLFVLITLGCIHLITVLFVFSYLTSPLPIILWWTPFMVEKEKVITCSNGYRCLLTKDRKYKNHQDLAVFLFYGSNINVTDLPVPKNNNTWAIFHEESPKNVPFFLHKEGQDLFDVTATFSRFSDFPITLQFLENLNLLLDLSYFVPVKEKNKLLSKIAPVLYIQSDCDTPIQRDDYVKELMKYIKVDSYGACLNNKKLPDKYTTEAVMDDLYEEEFMKFVARYKFIITMENAICDDYITEKLWRALIVGSIPIYLGSSSVEDWLPNKNSAVLIKNFHSVQDLAEHVHELNSDDESYQSMLDHKLKQKIRNELLVASLTKGQYGIKDNTEFPIPAFECFVCTNFYINHNHKLQTGLVYDCKAPESKFGYNWWTDFWKSGRCDAKALQYFAKNGNLSEQTFKQYLEELKHEDAC